MRVLLAAYQCGPGMGSVSQIGWEWYSRLASRVPVTLVTHTRNRAALEAAGAPLRDSEIIYIDTEWFAGPVYRTASSMFPNSQHSVFLLSSMDFYVYDRYALRELQHRSKQGQSWDVVHAVTPVSPVATTVLHRLGLPLIIGPLNGGLRTPSNFPEFMRQDSAWLYPLRNLGRIADAITGSSRNAEVILTATRATREAVPARHRDKCRHMLENGVDLDEFEPRPWPPPPRDRGILNVVFVGRLIPAKAVPLLLRAVRKVRSYFPVHLDVVGDGPMESAWTTESRALGIEDAVAFVGARPLNEVPAFIADAHVFCLPSVRESGGAVILEAMAVARPVIAVAYGGPAELVDDEIGRPISPDGSDTVVTQIAAGLQDVIDNPERWRARGLEGRRRAEQLHGWDAKIGQAIEIYESVVTARRVA
jgi:glycosyltransferase involved in cell wall biosynthesis